LNTTPSAKPRRTLYNYASFIEGWIEAVDRSADLLNVPIEIIIIDDASTDDALAPARRAKNSLAPGIRS